MGSEDLTVLSVFWGNKYDKGYVYALKEMVEKNLTIPHDFKCITTEPLPGIQTVLPFVPYDGWWQKIGLFAPTIATGPSLYFDLDVLITGNIDYLAEYTDTETLAAPANWAQSGHGGIQSSVMAWRGRWTIPFDMFRYKWKDRKELASGHTQFGNKVYWGDQEFLWDILGDNWKRIEGVGSYKYHVRPNGEVPDWMNVCVFHGKPDPHEVNDPCLSAYTTTLRNHIKSNMVNGSRTGLSGTG